MLVLTMVWEYCGILHRLWLNSHCPMDKVFESMAFQNITCFIAGKIITEYSDTSIGVVLGLKYKWTHND